jgi:hypothetical protein
MKQTSLSDLKNEKLTKESCIQKYIECKRSKNGEIPERDEFLRVAGIPKGQLQRVFGPSWYSKLQAAAGDIPNKLQLERTPFDIIMRQYGNLVTEVKKIPRYADWDQHGLRPTDGGLSKIHGVKWSEMPDKFMEWVRSNNISEFDEAIQIICTCTPATVINHERPATFFSLLIKDVREWTPALRRNSEGEYKIELRKHLESLKYDLNEECGDSNCDLLVEGKCIIELKKDPSSSEYDRLFGQIARHLGHSSKIVVLILQATRGDKYDDFVELVDRYLNVGENLVEVIKR